MKLQPDETEMNSKAVLSKCLMSNRMYAVRNAKYMCVAMDKYLYLTMRG